MPARPPYAGPSELTSRHSRKFPSRCGARIESIRMSSRQRTSTRSCSRFTDGIVTNLSSPAASSLAEADRVGPDPREAQLSSSSSRAESRSPGELKGGALVRAGQALRRGSAMDSG